MIPQCQGRVIPRLTVGQAHLRVAFRSAGLKLAFRDVGAGLKVSFPWITSPR
jgi:hypothetical protein